MTEATPAGRWRIGLTVILALMVLALDQLSKTLIVDALGPGGDRNLIQIIPGVLRLIYVQNTGAAFGIFQGRSPLLMLLAVAVVVFLLIYFRQSIGSNSWLALALGLQIGGALGNIVDRVRYGYVVDFINVPHWPTFNVADSAITVGVIVLGLSLLLRDPDDARARPPAQTEVGEQP